MLLILDLAYWGLTAAVLARVVFSWVGADPTSPVVHFVVRVTEPLLSPLRRLLSFAYPLDLSPMALLLLLYVARVFLFSLFLR